ncbi:endo-1,4-beta-xylanase [Lewinella marina]|uniref:Beta-xylanase n=1 Tax=Neolewinella marina TaxID=438751 RepID=A0A2G0CJB8_9BACT|nr:endo-1,4-beta-xylanase [Neolewinella marina]NJB84777.1 endo-1,4-beta-xylanase [Neolewinella marina]PHL00064.1 1,4-beta-xylanase [Neolewinella marina]
MNAPFLPFALLVLLLSFGSCGSEGGTPPPPPEGEDFPVAETSIGRVFADHFYVGAAVNRTQIAGEDTAGLQLLEREFTSITPENVMKWERIQPGPDSFAWAAADGYVDLGERLGMWTIGHTLVWHSQLPEYVSQTTNPGQLRRYLEEHIRAVAGRYAGRIDGWDVVNEALNEDGSYRESVFYRVLGEQYLVDAFRIAAEAAPDAELYYNDYNLYNPRKRQGALRIIKLLQDNGVRIDGVGMQGHYSLKGPPLEEVEASIEAYAATGVKVMITELDLTTLPNPWDLEGAEVSQNYEGDPSMDPYPDGLPEEEANRLADRYAELFSLFLKHDDAISRVTFWGVNDAQSWLNNWPIRGRTNHPLLFDRASQHKAAYQRVLSLKAERQISPPR